MIKDIFLVIFTLYLIPIYNHMINSWVFVKSILLDRVDESFQKETFLKAIGKYEVPDIDYNKLIINDMDEILFKQISKKKQR